MDKLHIRWIWISLSAIALTVISYEWLDHPVARFLFRLQPDASLSGARLFNYPAMFNIALGAIFLGLACGSYCAVRARALPKPVLVALLAGLAVVWSLPLEESILKPFFGRPNPSTYLQNGVDGFNWFHGSVGFASFPSGHMEQAMAILSVLWAFYPGGRAVYAVAAILLGFALMLGQWHFLSDIVAGALVGAISGMLTVQAWKFLAQQAPILLRRGQPASTGNSKGRRQN